MNREEHKRKIQAAKETKIRKMTLWLSEIFDVNTTVHTQNITVQPDEKLLDEIKNIEIPKIGRETPMQQTKIKAPGYLNFKYSGAFLFV